MLLLSQELVAENEMEQDVFVCCCVFWFPNAPLSPFLLLCAALISGFLTLYFSVHSSYFLSGWVFFSNYSILYATGRTGLNQSYEQVDPVEQPASACALLFISHLRQNTTEQQCLFFLFQSSCVHFGSPGVELFTKKTFKNFYVTKIMVKKNKNI